jgi:AcrR family transcriptional regulator
VPRPDGIRDSKASAHVSAGAGFRRRPSQERAAATVEAICQAAAELFCRIGYDRASTNRIAERAGVSIGSLYQYFSNKEAILAALLEEHRRAVHVVVEDALFELEDPNRPLDRGLAALFHRLVDLHAVDPELTRVLTEEVPRVAHGGPDADETSRYVSRVAAVLRARPEVRVANLEVAATVLVTTIEALTRWLAHAAPPGTNTDRFIREAVVMLVGYLCPNV